MTQAIPGVFKAEDFQDTLRLLVGCGSALIDVVVGTAAREANARLAEIAKDWPSINIWQEPEYKTWHGDTRPNDGATHTARLAFITELKPKVCEHEPHPLIRMNVLDEKLSVDMTDIRCAKCGAKLKARWELAE